MLAIGNDELGEKLGKMVKCPHCHKRHLVKTSYAQRLNEKGNWEESEMNMQSYKCGKKAYICGIDGQSIMDRFGGEYDCS